MQADNTIEVVGLQVEQLSAAANALARAFHQDPFAIYMIPDSEERALSLPLHFTTAIRMGHLFGEVFTTVGNPLGAAVWFPPDGWQLTHKQLEEVGVGELEKKLPEGAFDRLVSALSQVGIWHMQDMPEPHWYLSLLGVDCHVQGRGIGSALLKPILSRADHQQLPCYLETTEAKNREFYHGHGFEVVVEDVEPTSGIDFWTYRRSPRAL